MNYMLVLQWPAVSMADYDRLISMENRLISEFDEGDAEVDGHDFGSGTMNIFIFTDSPLDAFRRAEAALSGVPGWATVHAAYRPAEGDDYTAVWPETLEGFSVL